MLKSYKSSFGALEDQVRFYGAEVLLALEYLHMMGFIYRGKLPHRQQ
jgi:serine/threonine protein kinase